MWLWLILQQVEKKVSSLGDFTQKNREMVWIPLNPVQLRQNRNSYLDSVHNETEITLTNTKMLSTVMKQQFIPHSFQVWRLIQITSNLSPPLTTILQIFINSILLEALVTVHFGQQCYFTAQVISWALLHLQNTFSTRSPLLNVENLSLQGHFRATTPSAEGQQSQNTFLP